MPISQAGISKTPRGEEAGTKNLSPKISCNPLKNNDYGERIQGNPSFPNR
jgi:hypothetical protein